MLHIHREREREGERERERERERVSNVAFSLKEQDHEDGTNKATIKGNLKTFKTKCAGNRHNNLFLSH